MNAEYTTSLLYPGNPYVEALPPMLAGQELIRALASVPLYSTSDRDRSTRGASATFVMHSMSFTSP